MKKVLLLISMSLILTGIVNSGDSELTKPSEELAIYCSEDRAIQAVAESEELKKCLIAKGLTSDKLIFKVKTYSGGCGMILGCTYKVFVYKEVWCFTTPCPPLKVGIADVDCFFNVVGFVCVQ